MEVKLSVNYPINSDDKDNLAQLFYEAFLMWSQEKRGYAVTVLGIYGNHATSNLISVCFEN